MRDLRQGNDLAVVWSILRDGKPFILSGKEWKLYLKNMYERKEVDDFSVKGNQIHWTFYGKDQKTTGRYSLILVGNENEKGMITTDTCDFVNVVSCSCKVQNSEDSPNVETETIELTSELEYVANAGGSGEGGSYDDTLLWEALDNKVDKVDGKGLSSNDYTDEDREKLAGLENYDDAKLKEELSETYQPKGDYVETKNLATINGKPLNEGGNIEIESGSGGASIEVDSSLSTTSTNPVQNKVITEALSTKLESEVVASSIPTEEIPFGYDDTEIWAKVDELSAEVGKKQDTISDLETIRSGAAKGATAIQEVKTINGQSIVGSGNIEIQGGGEPSQYIKDASKSADGSTLTLTKKDGSIVSFSPSGGGGGGDDTMTRILAGATPFICYKKTDGTIGFWEGYFVGMNHRLQEDIVEILFGGFGPKPDATQFLNSWKNLERIYPLMNGSGSTNLSFAFMDDAKLKDLSMLKDWDVSQVTDANSCFAGCAPEILPIENWNIAKIANMSSMFKDYKGIDVDFSRWTNNVVTTLVGFMRGSSVKKADLHNINTENCTSFEGAMRSCNQLQWLDIRGWSCVSATSLHAMLNGCSVLTTLVGDTSIEDIISEDIKVLEGYTATSNLSIKESNIPLNRASLRALINGLADMTETGATLPIGSANIAKLTNDDIAVATAKGWTIS